MATQEPLMDAEKHGILIQRKDIKKFIAHALNHLEIAKQALQPVIQSFENGNKTDWASLAASSCETIEMAQGFIQDLDKFT